jgi:hypothetical protein
MTCKCGCGCTVPPKPLGKYGMSPVYLSGHRASPKTVPIVCEMCRRDAFATPWNVLLGWGRFCSVACKREWMRTRPSVAVPQTIRTLDPGEAVPTGKPKRYIEGRGYVRLRWKVGTQSYVETYEHRIVAGAISSVDVHHIDENKQNNDPSNLVVMTRSEHARHHVGRLNG